MHSKEKSANAGQDPRESRDSGFSKKTGRSAARDSGLDEEEHSLRSVKVVDPGEHVVRHDNDKRD